MSKFFNQARSHFSAHPPLWVWLAAVFLFGLAVFGTANFALAQGQEKIGDGDRLITVYDNGSEKTIVTKAATIASALEQANIAVESADAVEPALDTQLVAKSYSVNIYRARPVVVVDGEQKTRVMTAAQSPAKIAESAGVTLYAEDETNVARVNDVLSDGGAGLTMTIDRATAVNLVLYGQNNQIRTQAKTVGDLLDEKGVKMDAADTLNTNRSASITDGMTIEVWRNGTQTVTQDEAIPFETEQIQDADQPAGYKAVKEAGQDGVKSVTYEIEMRNGQEISRKEIQSVTSKEPKKQIEIVGVKVKPGQGLTKSMGVNQFTDSRGVTHRETYYDLPMNRVMQNCGQGGYYTVREDGVKVDRDGYVIIAANLGIYPRCSVVETSVGPGKVYDTGGFAAYHPHGWDIATDWTNYNGV